MAHPTAARTAPQNWEAARYQRHRPEQTLLYRIIELHYPVFVDHIAGCGGADVIQKIHTHLKEKATPGT